MEKHKNEKKTVKTEEMNNILERTIGFVDNCDTKASIMLALFGVLLTVLCTSKITDNISEIVDTLKQQIGGWDYVYIVGAIISLLLLATSVGLFILVLSAKVQISGFDSKIFFKDISENSSSRIYGKKVKTMTEDEYVNDIINQIYINAKICTEKYERYNLALTLGTIGSLLFIMLYIVGSLKY